ncbi:unnamed protein product [Cuscuta campestris]|uniref:Uncharacterized protein n=1 Tax=Cuscuta campestris TaxID=132261 RepID=A0A484KV25_9ASTE|nr:unnamed protein product [Cuscuta campestris]
MGRSPCCEKAHTNKGAWTKEEDERLTSYIKAHGEGCWRSLPKAAGLLRCGKSCRLRWINYLRPDLKRGNFSSHEDDLIIKLHSILGNKWSLIAGRLPGRTDNEIKNYWNTHIRRKLLSRGIDPATHRPLGDPPKDDDVTSTISFDHLPQQQQEDDGTNFRRECCCPDLNLDLTISPPEWTAGSDPEKAAAADSSSGAAPALGSVLCFPCSLGIEKSPHCTCGNNAHGNGCYSATVSTAASSTAAGCYDFLGVRKSGHIYL